MVVDQSICFSFDSTNASLRYWLSTTSTKEMQFSVSVEWWWKFYYTPSKRKLHRWYHTISSATLAQLHGASLHDGLTSSGCRRNCFTLYCSWPTECKTAFYSKTCNLKLKTWTSLEILANHINLVHTRPIESGQRFRSANKWSNKQFHEQEKNGKYQ